MAAVKAGANRQEMHEVIREHALQAWAEIGAGRSNPLLETLCADPRVTRYVNAPSARALLDARAHVGNAAQKAHVMAARLQS
jgi:adenylosuccinate lyase